MVERGVRQEQGDLFLPPGFRFYPTDEEVITSYLLHKILNPSFAPRAMGEVNLNNCEPWDLPSKAKMGEKEWYFFCHKDMKYPTGMRTNRATEKGYWKATGKDREIFKTASAGHGGRELVGMKKTLVFYMGRAPRGTKTNWVMHEFRLEGKYRDDANLHRSPKDEWVVCKVFHKNNGVEDSKKAAVEDSAGTPNVSSISVDAATGGGDDFVDSMIQPMHFINSTGTLPGMTAMNAAAAAPYNAASYSIFSGTAAAATTASSTLGSFVDLPSYGFNDATTSRTLHQQAAVANSTIPTSSSSYSSAWNLLHAGGSYNLHDQAMMARAQGLGGVISPNLAGGLPSSSLTGISQQNSLGRDYGSGGYATNYLTASSAASTATVMGQAANQNLGAGVVRY